MQPLDRSKIVISAPPPSLAEIRARLDEARGMT